MYITESVADSVSDMQTTSTESESETDGDGSEWEDICDGEPLALPVDADLTKKDGQRDRSELSADDMRGIR